MHTGRFHICVGGGKRYQEVCVGFMYQSGVDVQVHEGLNYGPDMVETSGMAVGSGDGAAGDVPLWRKG